MANGMDRLERLFSKRKYATARDSAAASTSRPSSLAFAMRKGSVPAGPSPQQASSLQEMRFPQPSFIRPKATRMVPRDDHTAPAPSSRPTTAGRSQSVPEPPTTSLEATAPSLRGGVAQAARSGETRGRGLDGSHGFHAPPVSFTQARSGSAVTPRTEPNHASGHDHSSSGVGGYYESRRSSSTTNNTATTLSSGSSTISSCASSNDGNRHSYIETSCDLGDAATLTVPKGGAVFGSVSSARHPHRSSSLLQRRDLFLAPLTSLDHYQLQHDDRASTALALSSGEVSPTTVLEAAAAATATTTATTTTITRIMTTSATPTPTRVAAEGDEAHVLQDRHGLVSASSAAELQPPVIFTHPFEAAEQETTPEAASSSSPFAVQATSSAAELAVAAVAAVREEAMRRPRLSQPVFTETPVLRRDSLFAPIALPQQQQHRPSSSPVISRRRSRLPRRPMSMRYQRHLPTEPSPSSPSSVLMEPNLDDFLSLSDDDIAEAVPAPGTTAVAAEKKSDAAAPPPVPRTPPPPPPHDSAATPAASARTARTVRTAKTAGTPSPTKLPVKSKGMLELQKPLPPTPTEAGPAAAPTVLPTVLPAVLPVVPAASPPASPTSATRRLALVIGAPSQPPSFQAPPPTLLSLLPGMPPLPPSLSTSVGLSRTPVGEARMAAAFEIARIASRYQFDLAYIATMSPKNMALGKKSRSLSSASTLSSPASPASSMTSATPTTPTSSASVRHVARTNSQVSRMSCRAGPSHTRNTSLASQSSFMSSSSFAASVASHGTAAAGVSSSSGPIGAYRSKLEAKFLAAFGLATVRAPYSLSAPTHAKILNAERWLEFNEPAAKPDEFARGYGCAFYRSHAPVAAREVPAAPHPSRYRRRPSADDCDADTEQDGGANGRTTPRPVRHAIHRASAATAANTNTAGSMRAVSTVSMASTTSALSAVSAATSLSSVSSHAAARGAVPNNRGIVFVAYRRKEVADERARRQEKDDLDALYRDVEALVDRILDVHMQQQRQAQLGSQRAMPDMDDVLAAGFAGTGVPCTLRRSRFLGVRAAA